jgi:phage terminase Nu1 subunit (DNA packaging protein)
MAKASQSPRGKTDKTQFGVPAVQVQAHLSLSNARWADYRARGVFTELPGGRFDLDACRESYIKHLREQAAGRSGSAGEQLSVERAKLAKEQGDRVAMENAVRRGELLEVDRVIDEYVSDLGELRAGLSVIPSKVGQECATMTPAEIAQYVAQCIDDAFIAMRPAEEVVQTAKVAQMGKAQGSA